MGMEGIRVEYHNTQYYLFARVSPFEERWAEISVSRDFDLVEQRLQPDARINWPAIGAVSVAQTAEFVAALNKAMEVAREFERPTKIYRIYNEGELLDNVLGNNDAQVLSMYPKNKGWVILAITEPAKGT